MTEKRELCKIRDRLLLLKLVVHRIENTSFDMVVELEEEEITKMLN